VRSCELVIFNEPQNLVDVSSDVGLVVAEVLDDVVWVDDHRPTEVVSGAAHVKAELDGYLGTEVTDEGISVRPSPPSLRSWPESPAKFISFSMP
jgi:hypothetical protein